VMSKHLTSNSTIQEIQEAMAALRKSSDFKPNRMLIPMSLLESRYGKPGLKLEAMQEGGLYRCCITCGARTLFWGKDEKRFLRRHPKLCKERGAFMRQLAQGVRSVESEPRGEEGGSDE
jgi:hypothetical protein